MLSCRHMVFLRYTPASTVPPPPVPLTAPAGGSGVSLMSPKTFCLTYNPPASSIASVNNTAAGCVPACTTYAQANPSYYPNLPSKFSFLFGYRYVERHCLRRSSLHVGLCRHGLITPVTHSDVVRMTSRVCTFWCTSTIGSLPTPTIIAGRGIVGGSEHAVGMAYSVVCALQGAVHGFLPSMYATRQCQTPCFGNRLC